MTLRFTTSIIERWIDILVRAYTIIRDEIRDENAIQASRVTKIFIRAVFLPALWRNYSDTPDTRAT